MRVGSDVRLGVEIGGKVGMRPGMDRIDSREMIPGMNDDVEMKWSIPGPMHVPVPCTP